MFGVNTHRHRRPSGALDGKRGYSRPLVLGPPLVLFDPRVDAPSYRELEADDPLYPLYPLAAEGYHRPSRSLMLSLTAAWPWTQGDMKEREHRELVAGGAWLDGATVEAISAAFTVQADTARRWIRRAVSPTEVPASVASSGEPRVEVAWAEHGEEPEDPGDSLPYARWLAADPGQVARRQRRPRPRPPRPTVIARRSAVEERAGPQCPGAPPGEHEVPCP